MTQNGAKREAHDCGDVLFILAQYSVRLFFAVSVQPYRVNTRNPSRVTVRDGFETVEMQR